MMWFLRHLGAPIEMSKDCVLLLPQLSTNCGAWDQENWSSGGFAPILWLCRRQGGSFVSMWENSFFQATRLLHCLARQLIVQLIVLQKRLEGDCGHQYLFTFTTLVWSHFYFLPLTCNFLLQSALCCNLSLEVDDIGLYLWHLTHLLCWSNWLKS